MGRPKGSKNVKKNDKIRSLRDIATKEEKTKSVQKTSNNAKPIKEIRDIKVDSKPKISQHKKTIKPEIIKERDIDNKVKVKKPKKIKHSFSLDPDGCFYFASKIILRINEVDGFRDVEKIYENDVTFNKNNKIGGKTYVDGIQYVITEVITTEVDLTYVLDVAI